MMPGKSSALELAVVAFVVVAASLAADASPAPSLYPSDGGAEDPDSIAQLADAPPDAAAVKRSRMHARDMVYEQMKRSRLSPPSFDLIQKRGRRQGPNLDLLRKRASRQGPGFDLLRKRGNRHGQSYDLIRKRRPPPVVVPYHEPEWYREWRHARIGDGVWG